MSDLRVTEWRGIGAESWRTYEGTGERAARHVARRRGWQWMVYQPGRALRVSEGYAATHTAAASAADTALRALGVGVPS